jgi:hypothetical protein
MATAHLADPFVLPEAEVVERRRRRRRRKASRPTGAQKHRKHATCVHLVLQQFEHEINVEETAARHSECLGSLIDARISVVVI